MRQLGKVPGDSSAQLCLVEILTLPYENIGLWKKAFPGNASNDVRVLADQYAKSWGLACSIAKRISSDAAGLTLHDESHFLALWKAADRLVPAEVDLSPIELFIFGVSILIHDAAHTMLAYEGGIDALTNTAEWRDNLATRLIENKAAQTFLDLGDISEPIRKQVVFDTLRDLHAKQSPRLLSLSFKHPAIGVDFFIVEDPILRRHLGEVIGTVAASHHWSISRLENFTKTINVPSPYDAWGPVRQLYLAALMRTADATQIDSARAPDFELTLTNPIGVSNDHWVAQNRIAVGVDSEDPEALSINSTVPFGEDYARAWWVAYDLARLADKELRETDALLRDYKQPRLCLRRVKDVETPERFSENVKADGWQPINAEVKVGDTSSLVTLLGGRGLYGDNIVVPLRELLQNAVDAVRARRVLDENYHGKITVELAGGNLPDCETGFWLRVLDDGIGMSQAILTGPFLTFGQSGWTSSALRKEYPGFISCDFKRIGKYGIGFFSVFMISENVRVTSRGFSQGKSDSKTVQFSSGLGLRPLIKPSTDNSMSTVTSVELFIDADTKEKLLYRADKRIVFVGDKRVEKPPEAYSLAELIEVICPAVDVDIETFDGTVGARKTIRGDWQTRDAAEWLCAIHGIQPYEIPEEVIENMSLIQVVGSPSRLLGRAALSPCWNRLGIYTVGGFASKKTDRSSIGIAGLIGSLDRLPAGPKRDVGAFTDDLAVASWASEQIIKWAEADISEQQKNFVAAAGAEYGGDVSPLANALIDGEWMTICEIYSLLADGKAVYAPVLSRGRDYWMIGQSVNLPSGQLYHPDDVQVEIPNVLIAGATSEFHKYWEVPDDISDAKHSFLGILLRYALSKGREIAAELKIIDFGSYQGESIMRQGIVKGERISIPGLVLTLTDAG